MMDQFVTFGDLLKIGSILLELASLVFYIYYNHKHSNKNHRDENKKQKYPPLSPNLWRLFLLTKPAGANRLLISSLFVFIIL